MLYVIYIAVDGSRATEWVKWMVDEHMPAVMKSGCFVSSSLVRDSSADSAGRVGYRAYFRTATDADMARYEREFADRLQAAHTTRYAGAFNARREVLPVVTHF